MFLTAYDTGKKPNIRDIYSGAKQCLLLDLVSEESKQEYVDEMVRVLKEMRASYASMVEMIRLGGA